MNPPTPNPFDNPTPQNLNPQDAASQDSPFETLPGGVSSTDAPNPSATNSNTVSPEAMAPGYYPSPAPANSGQAAPTQVLGNTLPAGYTPQSQVPQGYVPPQGYQQGNFAPPGGFPNTPKKSTWSCGKTLGCGCLGMVLLFIALAIIGGKAIKNGMTGGSVPKSYLGIWQGQDGTTLSIRGDGRGDYKGGNVTVTGGPVNVDQNAKTLSIILFGIGKTFKIDKAPHNNGGTQEMTLDGTVFRRTQVFTAGSSDTSNTSSNDAMDNTSNDSSTGNDNDATGSINTASSDVTSDTTSDAAGAPSKEEATTLTSQTLLMFNDAVQNKDFTTFRENVSKPFQKQYSESKMRRGFQVFIDQKIDISNISEMQLQWISPPSVDAQGVLTLSGRYNTQPFPTRFDNSYVKEDGE